MCIIRRHFWWVQADSGGNVFFAKYAGPYGGSEQSGGKRFFREIWWPVQWVPIVRGETIFSTKYGGPSGGSLLSGGGIIILRVIRRHFLVAAVDPAVSLSMYSTLPIEVGP